MSIRASAIALLIGLLISRPPLAQAGQSLPDSWSSSWEAFVQAADKCIEDQACPPWENAIVTWEGVYNGIGTPDSSFQIKYSQSYHGENAFVSIAVSPQTFALPGQLRGTRSEPISSFSVAIRPGTLEKWNAIAIGAKIRFQVRLGGPALTPGLYGFRLYWNGYHAYVGAGGLSEAAPVAD